MLRVAWGHRHKSSYVPHSQPKSHKRGLKVRARNDRSELSMDLDVDIRYQSVFAPRLSSYLRQGQKGLSCTGERDDYLTSLLSLALCCRVAVDGGWATFMEG